MHYIPYSKYVVPLECYKWRDRKGSLTRLRASDSVISGFLCLGCFLADPWFSVLAVPFRIHTRSRTPNTSTNLGVVFIALLPCCECVHSITGEKILITIRFLKIFGRIRLQASQWRA